MATKSNDGVGWQGSTNQEVVFLTERYDKTVFAALQGADKPLSSEDLRAQVGGTPLQARASLARLINSEKVTWEGKARGTRYSAVD